MRFTMAIRCGFPQSPPRSTAIDEDAWVDIEYPDGGQAQSPRPPTRPASTPCRLIVRRTRLTGRAQQKLWPDWRHHAFLTDLDGDVVEVDRFHRQHATVELAIRDLKDGAGLEHVPSGRFHANSAWLQCAVLAHNLTRWTAMLGEVRLDDQLVVARSVRTRLLALPGRLVNRSGRPTLRMPSELALGHHVRHRTQHAPRPDPPPADTGPAARRAATPTSADNPNRHDHYLTGPTRDHPASHTTTSTPTTTATRSIGGSRLKTTGPLVPCDGASMRTPPSPPATRTPTAHRRGEDRRRRP